MYSLFDKYVSCTLPKKADNVGLVKSDLVFELCFADYSRFDPKVSNR